MRTYSATPSEVEQKWYLIDAEGLNLVRGLPFKVSEIAAAVRARL